MTTEDRLRDALRAEAEQIQPRDGWARIESRLGETAPRNRMRFVSAVAVAAAIVLVAAAAVALQDRDDAKPVLTNPGESTTTTAVAIVGASAPKYIWPLGETTTYGSPDGVAEAFAGAFLGMPSPSLSRYRAMDPRSGEIDIRPLPNGGPTTTLVVREDSEGWNADSEHWWVVSAYSDNLQLDSPAHLGTISSPVTLTGRSVAFEGTVHVTLYGYSAPCAGGPDCEKAPSTDPCAPDCGGTPAHPFIATTTFTGHGTEMGPFEATLTYGPTPAAYGLLMLWTDSARDGSLAEATVRLVRLA